MNETSVGFIGLGCMGHGMAMNLVTAGSPWIGQKLEVGNAAFGLYQTTNSKDFVYLDSKSDETNREVILSVENSETINLNFVVNGKTLTVSLDGTKSKVPFNFTTKITRRI